MSQSLYQYGQLKGHAAGIYFLTHDSDSLLSGSGDGILASWDIETLQNLPRSVKVGEPIFSAWMDKELLLIGQDKGGIHVIDRSKKEEIRHLKFHSKGVFNISFNEKTNHFYSLGGGGSLAVFDREDFRLLIQIPVAETKMRTALISPDGSRLYFASNKDNPEIKLGGDGLDLWYMERNGSGWSDPVKLPETINRNLGEFAPSVASNGNIYYSITDENYQTFIYCSEYLNGEYYPGEKVKIDLQPDISIGSAFIAPDESYLLFQANMDGGFGSNDIYVTFRNDDGSWAAPVNLGEEINSEYNDFGPRVSFDGKYLFFSSDRNYPTDMYKGKSYSELIEMLKSPRNGYGTLYWVDASIIEKLKSEYLK